MRIDGNGNVGIGTTSPGNPLHVQSDTTSQAARIINTNANGKGLIIKAGSSDTDFVLDLDNAAGLIQHAFYASGRVFHEGNVGIGTQSPSFKLHVIGTAFATGAAGALSDRRHKTNISDLSFNALDTVNKLRPVAFEWQDPEDSGMEGAQLGFIAQEVEWSASRSGSNSGQ